MSLTDTERLRVEAIERKLNELQTASNNLATRKELKNLLALLERTILEVQTDLTQIELTGSGSALANHQINPDAHTQLNERYYLKTEHLATSAGVADAGKPIKLSASGVLDSSLLPGGGSGSGDHGSLGGLSDDDHTQYYNNARLEAWAASDDMVQSGLSDVHARTHEMDSIADHLAAVAANFGKYVRANPSTGAIEFSTITQDHGGLLGLSDDDHPQYLLIDGSRAMTGDLQMAANQIIWNDGFGTYTAEADGFGDFQLKKSSTSRFGLSCYYNNL